MVKLLFFEIPLAVVVGIAAGAFLLVSSIVSCVLYLSCLHRRRGNLSARPPLLPAKAGYMRQPSSTGVASSPGTSPRVNSLGAPNSAYPSRGSPSPHVNSAYPSRGPPSPHVNGAYPSPRPQHLALPPSNTPPQFPPDHRRALAPYHVPAGANTAVGAAGGGAAGNAPVVQESPSARKQPQKSPSWEDQLKAGMFRKMTLEEVRDATGWFSPRNFVGEGGFAVVFRGKGPGDVGWAVKRSKRPLSEGSAGARDFEKEVFLISRLSHKSLVRLLGYCMEAGEYILVYELAANGSLGSALSKSRPHLTFIQRLDIAIGTAEALHYLHTAVNPPIVHRDIKPDNILLDQHLNAKLGDFGLLKSMLGAGDSAGAATSAFTRVAGTPGYLDPDYHRTSKVTTKGDVYSFGVVLLELFTGQRAIIKLPQKGAQAGGGIPAKRNGAEKETADAAAAGGGEKGGGGEAGGGGAKDDNARKQDEVEEDYKAAAAKKGAHGSAPAPARDNAGPVHISHWVGPYVQARDVAAVADSRLGCDYDAGALLRVLQVALQCVRPTRARPEMAAVLRVLVDAKEQAGKARGGEGLMTVGEEEGEGDEGGHFRRRANFSLASPSLALRQPRWQCHAVLLWLSAAQGNICCGPACCKLFNPLLPHSPLSFVQRTKLTPSALPAVVAHTGVAVAGDMECTGSSCSPPNQPTAMQSEPKARGGQQASSRRGEHKGGQQERVQRGSSAGLING
ncbi:unnamed protein product [Closterium sp. NIES-64]|nr:unnamed protein product [Closterium sp. NIES-64]